MRIEGIVNEWREATLSLLVRGPINGRERSISAILDTGFDDYLTLSLEQVTELALPALQIVKVQLADGSVTEVRLFEVEVFWMGEWRSINVQEAVGEPLVGMALMVDCRITVEVWAGGAVHIETVVNEGKDQ